MVQVHSLDIDPFLHHGSIFAIRFDLQFPDAGICNIRKKLTIVAYIQQTSLF
jgi:hypothetical protein